MIFSVLKQVYREKFYPVLTGVSFLLFLVFTIVISNLKLLIQLISGRGEMFLRLKIFFNLLLGITTNFSFVNAFLAFLIAFLFGVYLTLFIFFVKKRRKMVKTGKKGFFTSLLGVIGVGCSSCGAVVLSMFLSTAGAASVIALLPLKGSEFALLSLIILYFSINSLCRNIIKTGICVIDKNSFPS